MRYIFFDTETTGVNVDFDQILQIAAILTNENFEEQDRFELRCRILPWVVPSPAALKVTGTSPQRLTDSALPSHLRIIRSLRKKFDDWSPATFIGYNSIRFDEELLRRALWQTLQSPWLTVSNGNSRLDLLPIAQVASLLRESALNWPRDDLGRKRFRLDRLAPLNDFSHSNAHDALSDVEATIYIARLLANRVPNLWQTVIARSTRKAAEAVLERGEPVLCFDIGGSVAACFCQRLAISPHNPSAMVLARLDTDWEIYPRGATATFA